MDSPWYDISRERGGIMDECHEPLYELSWLAG